MISPVAFLSKVVDFLLRHRRFFIFLIAIFFIVIGISTLCRGGIGPPPRRTDLTVFLRGAEAIQSGQDIYGVINDRGWFYVYTPLLAILLVPFTRLPLLLNTSLWYALSVASLCGAVFLSSRLVRDRTAGMRAAVMAMLFCIPPLVESMTRGQVGVMSVFLAVAILYLYIRGMDVWTGILFAFSVVLKASPFAPLIVFFLIKREWKIVISASLGIFFFALVFPSIMIGAGRNWSFLMEWSWILNHAISEAGTKSHLWAQLATPLAWDNQSLYAVIVRWAYPTETAFAASPQGTSLIRWSVRALGAAIFLILALASRHKKSQIPRKRLILEYSLFLVSMLIFSPVSEIHHYTIFFLLFFAVFLYFDELPRNSISYQSLMWSGLIAGITQVLCYIKPFGTWGLPVAGALLFCGASFLFLLRLKPGPDS